MLKHWKKLSTRDLFKNPWWTYKLDTFQIPDGVAGEYHYVYTHGSSMVVPITSTGHILMVNQYRYLCDRESLEFPCGSVKEGHSYEQTAHLELAEETGYSSTSVQELGQFNPYNGVTSEICTVYLAKDLIPAPEDTKKDATEEFERVHLTPAELEQKIATNALWDGMSLAAWMMARAHVL